MDTREKIRSLEEFVAGDTSFAWTVVLGMFDPLTVEVTRYIASLASAGRMLLVVVSDTVDSRDRGQGSVAYLSAEARARMLAALRVVDAVVIAPLSAAKDALQRSRIDLHIEEDPGADQRRSEQFIQYVLDRQASAVTQET